ncbi:MAG: hypothetical protein ACLGHY_14285, partial [Gammaproteobacteria bacterium]
MQTLNETHDPALRSWIESANRPDFDQLFRSHVANVYTLLGLSPPEELSRPILKLSIQEYHERPTGP